jgi:hypothetical protein
MRLHEAARPTHDTSKRDLLNPRAVDLCAVLGEVVCFFGTSKLDLSAFVQLSCIEGWLRSFAWFVCELLRLP